MSENHQILMPPGHPTDEDPPTERERERRVEDEQYVPVILKRTDEKRRHPDDTLETAIQEGLEQIQRPAVSLALSSVAAGLIIGFSPMAVAVVTSALSAEVSPLLMRLATAVVYPLGFLLCIMSGAQLFTEHTATAVYPVLDRKARVWQLLRLWGIVAAGNLTGAALGAWLHAAAGDVVQANAGYVLIARHLIDFDVPPLFISAVLAGWLMALGAWLVMASPRMGAQFVSVYVVTFLIGLGGFHHSIAGSAELFAALMMSTQFAAGDALRFIALALAGNLVGGSLFVALLNYAHIRRTQSGGA